MFDHFISTSCDRLFFYFVIKFQGISKPLGHLLTNHHEIWLFINDAPQRARKSLTAEGTAGTVWPSTGLGAAGVGPIVAICINNTRQLHINENKKHICVFGTAGKMKTKIQICCYIVVFGNVAFDCRLGVVCFKKQFWVEFCLLVPTQR